MLAGKMADMKQGLPGLHGAGLHEIVRVLQASSGPLMWLEGTP